MYFLCMCLCAVGIAGNSDSMLCKHFELKEKFALKPGNPCFELFELALPLLQYVYAFHVYRNEDAQIEYRFQRCRNFDQSPHASTYD